MRRSLQKVFGNSMKEQDGMVRGWRVRALATTAALGLVAAGWWVAVPDSGSGDVVAMGAAGAAAPSTPWTDQQAQVAAVKSGKQVEVAGRANTRQVTYANPDGSFTQETHVQPYRTLQKGKWVPIDTTMIRYPDGSVGPKAAVTSMRFSGGGDMPLATITRTGRTMRLTWPGGLPTPTLAGDTATYALDKDVDLVLRVSSTGYSHVLVVKTPEAMRDPRFAQVKYGLSGDHLTYSVDGGRLVAHDKGSGGLVFEAPVPKMWDHGAPEERADGSLSAVSAPQSSIRAEMKAAVKDGMLVLTPDAAMLARTDLRYPLYLDPYTAPHTNTSWAMVDSGYPDEENWKFDGDRDERIGLCNRSDSPNYCNNSYIKRLLYAIPTPYQDDTLVISAATFKITMVHTYDGSARNVTLYRMGAGISSATNWRNQPAWSKAQETKAPTVSQGSCTTTNHNVTFNAKAAVLEAQSNDWATTTFGLRANDEDSKYYIKRFCDNAVLSVTYNRVPAVPTTLTSNPGGPCRTGTVDNSWYVSSVPKLSAYLADSDDKDAEPLTARFTVQWMENGTQQTKVWTSGEKANKSTFDYDLSLPVTGVPLLPQNTVVSWYVESSDGTAWSTKSTTCGFILDTTKPAGPDIDSANYLPDDATDNAGTNPAGCIEGDVWHDGVGRYGSFTFDTSATDVVSYKYSFDGAPSTSIATTAGGPVSVSWLPLTEAPHTVSVIAVDAAGKESDTSSCTFRIGAGNAPIGQWKLDEQAGPSASDTAGVNHATAGAAVSFGQPGPGGVLHRSVLLDGSADSHLSTTTAGLLDTSKGFTVSAFVKVNDLSRPQAAVSQDGTGEPGFVLGYDGSGRWTFRVPVSDLDTLGTWSVSTGQTVTASTGWTHLTGMFDPVLNKLSLYVNGTFVANSVISSEWASHGPLQLGRRTAKTGYTDAWSGGLADVIVYDRLLMGAEIGDIAEPRLQRQVYWSLDSADEVDTAPGTYVSPEVVGDGLEADPAKELTLSGGAHLYVPDYDIDPVAESPLMGAGHLELYGTGQYAANSLPLAGTTGSFSVTARAKLAAACSADQVVLSQPGTSVSRFQVRCATVGGQQRWQLAVANSDSTTTGWTTVVDTVRLPNPNDAAGSHLAVTYNDYTKQVQLFVNGQLSGTVDHTAVWNGTDRGIQVGRALLDGTTTTPTYGSYFSGVIDDVRVYTGVLEPVTISRLADLTPQSEL
ncbi:LamG-like jellyroll fold domain-containing protein [Catellatospora sp. NPDC049133]|jgi:hypothetical protein|uniref:LamG-like jellyroll fold domain-containing protein n=1 Tax=Catellatospora sp. NPDC049133 TaxID=3155499 RepID=UPI0033E366BB